MKFKFIVFVVIFFLGLKIAAQPQPGSNVLHPELDKFIGTWIWNDGNGKEVTIMLKKINLYFPAGDYHEDVLLGSHQYKVNGNILQNYLLEFPTISQDHQSSVYLWYDEDFNANHLQGSVLDEPKHKRDNLFIDYIPGNPEQLTWKLRDVGGFIVEPASPGITMPADFTMTKQ